MKIRIIIFLFTLGILIGSILYAFKTNVPDDTVPQTKIYIDFSKKGNSITHSGIGFSHTPDPSIPSVEVLEVLNPILFRNSPERAFNSYERIYRLGAINEVVLSSAWTYNPQIFPGDNNNWYLWDKLVDEILQQVIDKNYKFNYDIWNEPDYPYFWTRTENQFLRMWTRTVNKIRQEDIHATIVGPSYSNFNYEKLVKFINFANDSQVLPDILSWHELDITQSSDLVKHVSSAREYIKENNINIKGIEINEYTSEKNKYNGAMAVKYFSVLEEAQLHAASRSCWSEIEGHGCTPEMLDNLLTNEGKPRSIWWVYKVFSTMKGQLIKAAAENNLEVLASINNNNAYVLIGSLSDFTNISIVLKKLKSLLVDNVRIHVYKIPYSKDEPLQPNKIGSREYVIKDDLIITLGPFKEFEVYFLILEFS